MKPFVSVIIPVYNDAERLKACLYALEKQTYPDYELIIIDNGSQDDIESVKKEFPSCTFTRETATGSYAARNRGISLAKGEILAFTDADCIPASDWIEKGAAALLKTSNCGQVGGRIKLFTSKNPTLVERYSLASQIDQENFIKKWQFAATANMFTTKKAIKHVGPFDSTLKSSGDVDWGQRVLRAGYSQIYAHEASVSHPARRTLLQLYKREKRLVGGWHDLLQKPPHYRVIKHQSLRGKLNYFRAIFVKAGKNHAVQILFLILFVRFVHAIERLRLSLGGKVER